MDIKTVENYLSLYDTEKTIKDYSNYLNNKKVVIVGPAPHIVGSNQHDLIESYEIVVRVNTGFNIPEKLEKDIGTRTDVLYTSLTRQEINENFIEGNKEKFKWFCLVINPEKDVAWNRLLNFKKINNQRLLLHVLDPLYVSCKLALYYSPPKYWGLEVGLTALLELLRFNIVELYITGFTFYLESGEIDGFMYYSEYDTYKYIRRARIDLRKKEIDPNINFKYFRRRYKNDKRIKYDKTLTRLFENYEKKIKKY